MEAQRIVSFVLFLALVAGATPSPAAPRKSHQLSCKRVREAVSANHTLEQLTAEFDTDAQHVMRCLQSKGKKKSSPGSSAKPANANARHAAGAARSNAKKK